MIRITNSEANEVVYMYTIMQELKKRGEIQDFEIKYNGERKSLDIRTVPVTATEYIKVGFTLTKDGAVFK